MASRYDLSIPCTCAGKHSDCKRHVPVEQVNTDALAEALYRDLIAPLRHE